MKKLTWFLAGIAALIAIGVAVCGPMIEHYEPDPKYYSMGYANTVGILEGLCLGEPERALGVVYSDHAAPGTPHPEKTDPNFMEKLDLYCQLIDGRDFRHIAARDYTLEGDYPTPPYTETSYMEILLEDGTMLYAIVTYRQDPDACGVTGFELFEACPW